MTKDPELLEIALIRIITAQLILSASFTLSILIGYIFKSEILFYILHTAIIIVTIITALILRRIYQKQREDEQNGLLDQTKKPSHTR